MIRRIDRIQTELPPPSDPDPAGAAAVQELLGGKFGEMSTFLNYTFQSFNFRNKQGARPFYDLVANIAAEEFGHVELVAKTINTMLTGATPTTTSNGRGPGSPLKGLKDVGNPHHFLVGGQGALPQNSQGRSWNGDYVFSSGDLIEDLTHNFFLETGARNGKLKVYRFSPSDYLELAAVFKGPHPETGEELEVVDEAPEGVPAYDLLPQPAVFAPDYAPEEIAAIAEKLRKQAGLSKSPSGEVANGNASATSKPRRATRKPKAAAKK